MGKKRHRKSKVYATPSLENQVEAALHGFAKRRAITEVPMLVERLQKTEQRHDNSSGLTYEEANWAKLSPLFRQSHNKLRQARGLPAIPSPLVDLYVAPPQPILRPFDATDKEVIAAISKAKFFDGGRMMGGGDEGFTINGRKV